MCLIPFFTAPKKTTAAMTIDSAIHKPQPSSHREPPLTNTKRISIDHNHQIQQTCRDPLSPIKSLDDLSRPIELTANSPTPTNPETPETISYPRHAFSASSPLNFEDFETIEVPIPTPPESSRASSLCAVHEGRVLRDRGESSLGRRALVFQCDATNRPRIEHA